MDRLSLIIRTLPHTGHPHPVLSSSTSVIFFSGITCKTSEKRDQLGSGVQTITTLSKVRLRLGTPKRSRTRCGPLQFARAFSAGIRTYARELELGNSLSETNRPRSYKNFEGWRSTCPALAVPKFQLSLVSTNARANPESGPKLPIVSLRLPTSRQEIDKGGSLEALSWANYVAPVHI